jgi:hypothetical protein
MNSIFTQYELGLLYGDGHVKEGGSFYFCNTQKELVDKIENVLMANNIKYSRYTREHDTEQKQEWSPLEIIEFRDVGVNDYIMNDPDFLRGYFETKATFFTYQNRELWTWRMSVSGQEGDLQEILKFISPYVSKKTITRRKERLELGIISESYRISIDKRSELAALISWIKTDDKKQISLSLSEKFTQFLSFHQQEPFGMNRVFKNYKYAVLAMAKVLSMEIRGVRGGDKHIYLWENDITKQTFLNWKEVYHWIREQYQQQTGKLPPIVYEKTP